jgi:hypothetical protein
MHVSFVACETKMLLTWFVFAVTSECFCDG